MEIVLLVARLLLALVFGVAGIAKAVDPNGSRRAMIGFGVPERLATPLARWLPVAEILIALALIPLNTAWVGAIAAVVLLLIFAVAIGVTLARGESPDCHCFGQLHSEPVRWSTFARNLMLMAAAGLVFVEGKDNPGMSALNWVVDLRAGEVISLIVSAGAVALLATGIVYLRRIVNQQSTVLARIDAMKKVIDEDYAEPPVEREDAAAPVEGLPVGAPAPSFSLSSIGGEQVTLDDLLVYGKPVLLLFVSPNCLPCETLRPSIKVWERDYGSQLTVALLSKGDLEENRDRMAKYEARNVLLQGQSGVAEEYEAKWTPAALLIRPDGRIASQVSYGDEEIRALVTRAVTPADVRRKRNLPVKSNGHKPQITIATPQALKDLGEPAPRFSLPDLQGEVVDNQDLLGRDTLLVFWDPKCPYCQEMVEDFERWEDDPPKGAPRLVFVSSGEEEIVREESSRIKSQFLHDPEFDVGPLFGTNRTPSAVLIDADGRIASGPTGGRLNILALAGVRRAAVPVA